MRNRMRGGCGPDCYPLANGGCDCDSVAARMRAAQRAMARGNLGFITNEITMSLGDGNVNLGYITPNITTSLGEDVAPSSEGPGKMVFWVMTLVIGGALGAAFGIQHGVKISRGG